MYSPLCLYNLLLHLVFNATGVPPDAELAAAIMKRHFRPSLIKSEAWEGYTFSNLEIKIKESTDCYGAVLWPSVSFLFGDQTIQVFKPLFCNYRIYLLFFLTRPWCCVIFLTRIRKNITF